MALVQSCIRCRSRRMKCDLRLPSCGACIQAEVECCTSDSGIGENVPRGYIHSLQRQVERLEQQIQSRQRRSQSSSISSLGQGDWQLPHEYDYVGSGSSVGLFDQLCRIFKSTNSTAGHSLRLLSTEAGRERPFQPLPLPLHFSTEHFLTPSLQRELIIYYTESVGPELPSIISELQEQTFLQDVNPLLVCSGSHNSILRIILLYIFAISARLISRDHRPEYVYIACICCSEAQGALAVFTNETSVMDETALDHVRVMCLVIVHELVEPSRSKVSMDLLNAGQLLLTALPYIGKDDPIGSYAVSQLGLFLSQVEASLCGHFRRPSMQYGTLRALSRQPTTWLDTCIQISQLLQRNEEATEAELASIIPQWQMYSTAQMTPETALVYLEAHSLFTADLGWLDTENVSPPCSTELLLHVSLAARHYIGFLFNAPSVLCIWMTLERVMKAGLAWAVFMIYQQRTGPVDIADLTKPLMQCDHILSVLVDRWKPGLAYYSSWDIVRQKALAVITQT